MRRMLAISIGLAVLAGIGLSALLAQEGGYGGALINAQEKARRLKCQNNLKQVWSALQEYRGKNGHFPSDLAALVEKKFIDKKLLKCPSSSTPADAIDYQIAPSAAGGEVLCRCRRAWHQGGRNLLKADGSVEWQKDK